MPNSNVEQACLDCGSPSPIPPGGGWNLSGPAVGAAELMLVPSQGSVDADGVIAVDVYIGPVADLRTFQVTLSLVGGDSGSVVIESIAIDAQGGDYVFNDLDTVWTTGAGNGVMLATLWSGGVIVTEPAYLGTFVLHASADAAGSFSLQVALGEGTLLRTSQSEVIAVAATPVIIPIADANGP